MAAAAATSADSFDLLMVSAARSSCLGCTGYKTAGLDIEGRRL
jgi:hypothetical protein